MKLYCANCHNVVELTPQEGETQIECPSCQAVISVPDAKIGPGVVVGGFLIESEISRGGMGKVFLARQLSLDRPVALKVLQDKFANDREYVESLVREARAAAKINHPNIVQAYSVGEEDGTVYFAMEYIRGETLKQTLKREHRLEYGKAAKIIRDVASALDVAWREQKLVHQDIKPDNIMLDANGFAKLADLGLAKTAADKEEEIGDEVLGTPQYISPEQLTGVPTDVRSDIYSLGATFYQFVTARFPYVADTGEELAHMHVEGNLQPPKEVNPELPDELNAIIMKMMARDIEKRYQSPALLVKALDVFLRTYRPVETSVVPKFDFQRKKAPKAAKAAPLFVPPPKMKAAAVPPLTPPVIAASGNVTEEAKALTNNDNALKERESDGKVSTAEGIEETVEKTAAESAAAPEVPAESAPEKTPVESAKSEETPVAAEPAKSEETPVAAESAKSEEIPTPPEVAESGNDGETAEEPVKVRKKFPRRLLIVLIAVIVLIVVLGGALGAFVLLAKRQALPGALKPAGSAVLKLFSANDGKVTESEPEKRPPTVPVTSAPKNVVPAKPEPPKIVTRPEFLREINRILDFARRSPDQGRQVLEQTDAMLIRFKGPVTAEEEQVLQVLLDEFYGKYDEKLRMAPAREAAQKQHEAFIAERENALLAEQQAKEKREAEAARLKEEADRNSREAAAERERRDAEQREFDAQRTAEMKKELDLFYREVAVAAAKAIAGEDPAKLEAAVKNCQAYRPPLGILTQGQKQELDRFQRLTRAILPEFRKYQQFIAELQKITPNSPFGMELPGNQLVVVTKVAPRELEVRDGNGNPVRLDFSKPAIARQFFARLHNKLTRNKKYRIDPKTLSFYYEMMNQPLTPGMINLAPAGFWKEFWPLLTRQY